MCCYRSLQSQVWIVVRRIGKLLITIFVELRVVAGRSRKRTGSPQAVSRRSCCAVVLRWMAWSEHGMGTACYVWIGLKRRYKRHKARVARRGQIEHLFWALHTLLETVWNKDVTELTDEWHWVCCPNFSSSHKTLYTVNVCFRLWNWSFTENTCLH